MVAAPVYANQYGNNHAPSMACVNKAKGNQQYQN